MGSLDDLGLQLERAIEANRRALRGSDKEWRRECRAEIERLRNRITFLQKKEPA